jgi:hypothetical protein
MNYLEPKPKPTPSLPSPPNYKNEKLEQTINENKNKSELNLGRKELTDDDMAIVAYYLLRNNKVSN